MQRLRKVEADWKPHYWGKEWTSRVRDKVNSCFPATEMSISTDFSAVYDHKAAAMRTCEQPHHSNMDVFVVTHSPRYETGEDGKQVRRVTTDIVRVISECSTGSLFHNEALNLIVKNYKSIVPGLERVHVFTDGCRDQYKGRRNFYKMTQFPSELGGIELVHRFAQSHHFKGSHDGYGKDAKLFSRTAERNRKRRLASTYDFYLFLATHMAEPLKEARTAKQMVDRLASNLDAEQLAQLQRHSAKTKPQSTRKENARSIIEMLPGAEEDETGVERTQERADPNPFGKPTNYHWLYFVDGPDHNMTVVPFGQKCRPNECHALLDPAKDFDADPVEGSNETFEMASTNADPNSGLLGCRQYPCPCLSCWPSSSFRPDHECESIMTVGRWRQATCFSAAGIGRQQTAKRQAIGKFAASVVPDKLYAAVGAFADRGRRPYWLLRTVSAAFKPPTTLKCTGGATVSTSQWAVKAYWYEAESDDANHRSYKI